LKHYLGKNINYDDISEQHPLKQGLKRWQVKGGEKNEQNEYSE